MVYYCCVYGCNNSGYDPSRSFHEFPKDDLLREIWTSRTQRKGFRSTKYSRICSDHFNEDDFIDFKAKRRMLKLSAVPKKVLQVKTGERAVKHKPPAERVFEADGLHNLDEEKQELIAACPGVTMESQTSSNDTQESIGKPCSEKDAASKTVTPGGHVIRTQKSMHTGKAYAVYMGGQLRYLMPVPSENVKGSQLPILLFNGNTLETSTSKQASQVINKRDQVCSTAVDTKLGCTSAEKLQLSFEEGKKGGKKLIYLVKTPSDNTNKTTTKNSNSFGGEHSVFSLVERVTSPLAKAPADNAQGMTVKSNSLIGQPQVHSVLESSSNCPLAMPADDCVRPVHLFSRESAMKLCPKSAMNSDSAHLFNASVQQSELPRPRSLLSGSGTAILASEDPLLNLSDVAAKPVRHNDHCKTTSVREQKVAACEVNIDATNIEEDNINLYVPEPSADVSCVRQENGDDFDHGCKSDIVNGQEENDNLFDLKISSVFSLVGKSDEMGDFEVNTTTKDSSFGKAEEDSNKHVVLCDSDTDAAKCNRNPFGDFPSTSSANKRMKLWKDGRKTKHKASECGENIAECSSSGLNASTRNVSKSKAEKNIAFRSKLHPRGNNHDKINKKPLEVRHSSNNEEDSSLSKLNVQLELGCQEAGEQKKSKNAVKKINRKGNKSRVKKLKGKQKAEVSLVSTEEKPTSGSSKSVLIDPHDIKKNNSTFSQELKCAALSLPAGKYFFISLGNKTVAIPSGNPSAGSNAYVFEKDSKSMFVKESKPLILNSSNISHQIQSIGSGGESRTSQVLFKIGASDRSVLASASPLQSSSEKLPLQRVETKSLSSQTRSSQLRDVKIINAANQTPMLTPGVSLLRPVDAAGSGNAKHKTCDKKEFVAVKFAGDSDTKKSGSKRDLGCLKVKSEPLTVGYDEFKNGLKTNVKDSPGTVPIVREEFLQKVKKEPVTFGYGDETVSCASSIDSLKTAASSGVERKSVSTLTNDPTHNSVGTNTMLDVSFGFTNDDTGSAASATNKKNKSKTKFGKRCRKRKAQLKNVEVDAVKKEPENSVDYSTVSMKIPRFYSDSIPGETAQEERIRKLKEILREKERQLEEVRRKFSIKSEGTS